MHLYSSMWRMRSGIVLLKYIRLPGKSLEIAYNISEIPIYTCKSMVSSHINYAKDTCLGHWISAIQTQMVFGGIASSFEEINMWPGFTWCGVESSSTDEEVLQFISETTSVKYHCILINYLRLYVSPPVIQSYRSQCTPVCVNRRRRPSSLWALLVQSSVPWSVPQGKNKHWTCTV